MCNDAAIIGCENGTDVPVSVVSAYARVSGLPLENLMQDDRDLWFGQLNGGTRMQKPAVFRIDVDDPSQVEVLYHAESKEIELIFRDFAEAAGNPASELHARFPEELVRRMAAKIPE